MSRCGDGALDVGEECDDGNRVSNDGCSRLCAVESGWVCLRQPNGTTHQVCTRCGDRKVEGNEQCDDGGTVSNDGCSSTCQEEPGFQCHVVGFPCAQCGNGMLELGEQCDDGQMAPTSGDGCTDRCQAEAGYDCRAIGSPCTFCGDGVVEGFETCDDFTHCADGANCTVGALRELGKNVDTTPQQGLGGATPQGSGDGGLVTSGDMARLMIGAYD